MIVYHLGICNKVDLSFKKRFTFWEIWRHQKFHSEINWPLGENAQPEIQILIGLYYHTVLPVFGDAGNCGFLLPIIASLFLCSLFFVVAVLRNVLRPQRGNAQAGNFRCLDTKKKKGYFASKIFLTYYEKKLF